MLNRQSKRKWNLMKIITTSSRGKIRRQQERITPDAAVKTLLEISNLRKLMSFSEKK